MFWLLWFDEIVKSQKFIMKLNLGITKTVAISSSASSSDYCSLLNKHGYGRIRWDNNMTMALANMSPPPPPFPPSSWWSCDLSIFNIWSWLEIPSMLDKEHFYCCGLSVCLCWKFRPMLRGGGPGVLEPTPPRPKTKTKTKNLSSFSWNPLPLVKTLLCIGNSHICWENTNFLFWNPPPNQTLDTGLKFPLLEAHPALKQVMLQ